MRTSLRRRGGCRGTAEPGCCARIGVRASARQNRMQFKNTSDVTVRTDTNEHTTGGELHAKLGGRRTTCQDTVATSVEETGGTGGPGCGVRGRWGAWSWCRWVAAGPGRASRSTAPSRQARVWRSRGRAAAHRHTERPGRTRQIMRSGLRAGRRPRAQQPVPTGHAHQNLTNWAASRPTVRSARHAILKSPGRPQCRRRNAPRALPGMTR